MRVRRWLQRGLALGLVLLLHAGPAFASEKGLGPLKDASSGAPMVLKRAAEAVRLRLLALDQDLSRAAQRLSGMDLKSEAARAVIGQLYAGRADIVIDASTISPEGVMLLVEPPAYRSSEGADISQQEQIQALLRTRNPVMSRVFRTVEGMGAVDMEYPISGADGKYHGSVSIIFQPWVLIGGSVAPLVKGMPVEIWAMQTDGAIIYDADEHEVSRLLFSDPEYQPFPELLQLGRRIAAEPDGMGSYSYFKAGTSQIVRKDAWWVTVTLHGMEWRLVSVHPSEGVHETSSAAVPFTWDALCALAREPAMVQALARGDREAAMNSLRQAALTHTGIYSLSYVDGNAVNRFGYPPDNSLFDVDLRTETDPASVAIVTAVKNHRELKYAAPLVEGGVARYFLMPIVDHATYLGSLLWVQKK